MLKVIKLEHSNTTQALAAALAALREGKVIVVPTDTVYGLVCDAAQEVAIELLFKIKKRDRTQVISLFVDSVEKAKELVQVGEQQDLLLRAFWPGAVTFVLKARVVLSALVIKDGTLGLRCPDHSFVLELLRQFGAPLAQSSANLSGQPDSHTLEEVLTAFVGQNALPVLIIDDGDLGKHPSSRVLDITSLPPKILRE